MPPEALLSEEDPLSRPSKHVDPITIDTCAHAEEGGCGGGGCSPGALLRACSPGSSITANDSLSTTPSPGSAEASPDSSTAFLKAACPHWSSSGRPSHAASVAELVAIVQNNQLPSSLVCCNWLGRRRARVGNTFAVAFLVRGAVRSEGTLLRSSQCLGHRAYLASLGDSSS